MAEPRRSRGPKPPAKLRDPILSRRLELAGSPRRRLTVRFDRPRRWRKDWICWFEIRGRGRSELRFAAGVDSVQALTLAMEMARIILAHPPAPLVGTFAGDPGGFPRLVLTTDPAELGRIHRLLDETTARQAGRRARRTRGSRGPAA